VGERLDLGNDLEAEAVGDVGEFADVVLLHVGPAPNPHMEGGGEAPRRPQRDALPQLVHGLAVGVPLGDGALPAHADLGVAVEPHPAPTSSTIPLNLKRRRTSRM